MGGDTGTLWGAAIGLVLAGLALWFFAGPLSSWNRRAGSTWGWKVPDEGSTGSWYWGAKYMRIIGAVATAAGIVMAIVAVSKSA